MIGIAIIAAGLLTNLPGHKTTQGDKKMRAKKLIVITAAVLAAHTYAADELPDAPRGTYAGSAELRPVSGTILYSPDGGVAGFIQVDLLAFNKREMSAREVRKAETRARREGMSKLEAAGDHLATQWPWYVGTLTAIVAVDRIAENNDALWHKSSSGGGETPATYQAQPGGTLIVNMTTVTGTGNTVNNNAQAGSTPHSSNNTGSGGVTNPQP